MSTPLVHRPESNGASVQVIPAAASGATSSGTAEYALPATVRGMGAQVAAALGLLTGLWVALSPLFLTLQYTGTNAGTVDLISGLAVAGVSALALASPRGFAGLQLGSAALGVWLIIAGPILNQKHPIADPMYWSNSWAGGVLIALASIALAAVALRRPARR
jgi:hypothetical protein